MRDPDRHDLPVPRGISHCLEPRQQLSIGHQVGAEGDANWGEVRPGQQVGATPDPGLGIENICTHNAAASQHECHPHIHPGNQLGVIECLNGWMVEEQTFEAWGIEVVAVEDGSGGGI